MGGTRRINWFNKVDCRTLIHRNSKCANVSFHSVSYNIRGDPSLLLSTIIILFKTNILASKAKASYIRDCFTAFGVLILPTQQKRLHYDNRHVNQNPNNGTVKAKAHTFVRYQFQNRALQAPSKTDYGSGLLLCLGTDCGLRGVPIACWET